jgi:CubicO group peptidase (beta-lactamase class C family)
MAHDGVWHAYQQGKHDVGAHGFNATLEDWGRFGEFVARDGRLSNGKQLVPLAGSIKPPAGPRR